MDLQNIVVDHGERELLDRLQGPMRFVGMFFIIIGVISFLVGLVDMFRQPALGVPMLLGAFVNVLLGGLTRSAGLSFRAAARNQSLPALRDGLSALVRIYRTLRWLIAVYLFGMAGLVVTATILAAR